MSVLALLHWAPGGRQLDCSPSSPRCVGERRAHIARAKLVVVNEKVRHPLDYVVHANGKGWSPAE